MRFTLGLVSISWLCTICLHETFAEALRKRLKPERAEDRVAAIGAPSSCESQYYSLFVKNPPEEIQKAPDLELAYDFLAKLDSLIPSHDDEVFLDQGREHLWTRLESKFQHLGEFRNQKLPKSDLVQRLATAGGAAAATGELKTEDLFSLGNGVNRIAGNFQNGKVQKCLSKLSVPHVEQVIVNTREQVFFWKHLRFYRQQKSLQATLVEMLEDPRTEAEKGEDYFTRMAHLERSIQQMEPPQETEGLAPLLVKELAADAERLVQIERECSSLNRFYSHALRKPLYQNYSEYLERCLLVDYSQAMELVRLVDKYKRGPGILGFGFRSDTFQNTMDFHANEFAVTWIEALPETLRKKAAEDVLRGLPPTLYPTEIRKILDAGGGQLSNESRALNIVLANPKMRDFLGCRFKEETPKYCGDEK